VQCGAPYVVTRRSNASNEVADRWLLEDVHRLDQAVTPMGERFERAFFGLAFLVFLGLTIGRAFFNK
jgi:hypothetical protein